MSKKLKKYILLVLLLLPYVLFGISGNIITSLKNGDSKSLSNHFNKSIELVVLEKENIYSKAQGEQVIKSFFNGHRPTDFKLIHEGRKENTQHAIGVLNTVSGNYRIYFLIKLDGASPLIHQLRIEEENGN